MAPKSKRAKIENHADAIFSNSDPEELVTLSRNELIKEVKSGKKIHGFTDLDIAIKTVRALILTNEEIWDRCKKILCAERCIRERERWGVLLYDAIG